VRGDRVPRYSSIRPATAGTTDVVLEPLELMVRLAARLPPPRMHLTRFHGVFAPHSRLRAGSARSVSRSSAVPAVAASPLPAKGPFHEPTRARKAD
jgi:hypothetical protein